MLILPDVARYGPSTLLTDEGAPTPLLQMTQRQPRITVPLIGGQNPVTHLSSQNDNTRNTIATGRSLVQGTQGRGAGPGSLRPLAELVDLQFPPGRPNMNSAHSRPTVASERLSASERIAFMQSLREGPQTIANSMNKIPQHVPDSQASVSSMNQVSEKHDMSCLGLGHAS